MGRVRGAVGVGIGGGQWGWRGGGVGRGGMGSGGRLGGCGFGWGDGVEKGWVGWGSWVEHVTYNLCAADVDLQYYESQGGVCAFAAPEMSSINIRCPCSSSWIHTPSACVGPSPGGHELLCLVCMR